VALAMPGHVQKGLGDYRTILVPDFPASIDSSWKRFPMYASLPPFSLSKIKQRIAAKRHHKSFHISCFDRKNKYPIGQYLLCWFND
jgi:hypothetical protein